MTSARTEAGARRPAASAPSRPASSRRTPRRDRARLSLLLPLLALLAGALGPLSAAWAQTTHTVAHDWPLIPKNAENEPLFGPGQKFRLLFVSSVLSSKVAGHRYDLVGVANANNIVQDAAGNNEHLKALKGKFRAVAASAANAGIGSSSTSAPIYWVGGEKVADGNSDFCDGNWASNNGKDESGTKSSATEVFTGLTKACGPNVQGLIGTVLVRVGNPSERGKELDAGISKLVTVDRRPVYGLSPVITVGARAKGVTLSTGALSLDEGASGGYTVVLDAAPTGDVTITPTSGDTSAVTVSTAAADDTLTFTTSNWRTPQRVSVAAVEDADSDDESVTVTHAVSGAGSGYETVTAASVTVAVDDDETADDTPPTVLSASTGYFTTAAATTTLTGPLKAGAEIYTRVTFSEGMQHVKSNSASARPELFRRIGSTDTRYDILDSGDTLASGDCRPNHSSETDVYICRYTVAAGDNGAFTVKAGTNSDDKAGHALAAAYTHTMTIALDTTAPAAPVSLNAAAGDAKVTLTWSDPSPADATIAKWQYRQKTTGSYGEWQAVTGGASARTVEVKRLSNGTDYTFQVRAVDTAGNEGAAGTTEEVSPAAANAAPTFTSAAAFSVEENRTAVGTVPATDGDSADC